MVLKRASIFLVAAVSILGLIYGLTAGRTGCEINRSLSTAVINGEHGLEAEVAVAGEDKARGLSGRKCLDSGRAMLFVYDEEATYCFWMKDMKFPIDIVWLDGDKKVVKIEAEASPKSYPATYCNEEPARYVLEVNAGHAAEFGWQIGTELNFSI